MARVAPAPITGKPTWQKATKIRAEVLSWLADVELAAELEALRPRADGG